MLSDFSSTPKRDRIIVALDCSADRARALGDQLTGHARWVKVGMTLFYACGPEIVAYFKERGFKVFLDLKLHDIPFQVKGAAASAARTGADMLTMHASGGAAMLAAGREGAQETANETGRNQLITLGITVLTSMDEPTLRSVGVERSPRDQVALLAGVAKESGISGVVASPQEASLLRDILGPQAYIVTPGVRPAGSSVDDQSRIATPAEAFDNGASHIVIGRPITQAPDPVAAFENIAQSVRS